MRDIKFRAWDARNVEFAFSDKCDCFYINTKGVLFMYALPKSESGLETIYHKSYDVEQFTGLQDINGKDIYEGDLLHRLDPVSFKPMAVMRGTDIAAFVVSVYRDEIVLTKRYIKNNKLVVIGNIHQNPELINNK